MHKKLEYFKLIFLCVFISLIFFTHSLLARESLPPRFSAAVYSGVYTVGQADLMVSLDGDQQHNLYVNPQGAYGSDQQWYGDLGLGYRWIKNDTAILGWYLFAGRSRVENSSGFWITNPGVEVMGNRWDARINAYIPVTGRSHELGLEEFNIVSTAVYSGHTGVINSMFNNVNAIQQIGNGADARVGYQLFRSVPLKGYLGAYFFDIANTDNVQGAAAGVEYWFGDNFRIFANYSYDNYQHSKVVGGLGINFGGVRKHWADPTLSERLTDPVDRYLANLGHGSGIPSKTLLYAMGRGSSSEIISNSIAFFSQTGTPNTGGNLTIANCTFENPCGPNDFTQAGVNSLNSVLLNTMFYFNGGTYPATNGANPLTLNNGQSIFSRTTDYSGPATGAARSTFNGGFNLSGNNQLDGIILNATTSALGVTSTGGQNIIINNSQIGSAGNPYISGLSLFNSTVTLENSVIFSNLSGIQVGNNSLLNIESSEVNASGAGNITGISLVNTAQLVINNSQVNVLQATGGVAIGIFGSGNSSAEINNSNIAIQNVSPNATAIGLETTNSAQMQMNLGSLSVTGDATSLLTEGTNISLDRVSCMLNGVAGC